MRNLALFALGLISAPALALVNVDLYQTEVVLDQSIEKPDAQARVDGMKEVIVRASGDVNANKNAVVQKALRQSAQYLSQLSYGEEGGSQTLQMAFNPPQIQALLSQAQLASWPSERENVLVWLVEENQAGRQIAWEHSDSDFLQQMRDQAERRGLPLTVPIGDFEDVTGISTSDLWGGFAQSVGQASLRYPADAVLVVRISGNNLRWTLYDQAPNKIGVTRQAPLNGTTSGSTGAQALINQISDHFAKASAVVINTESTEAVKVRFTELNNITDFFVIERKLKQLSSVASVDVWKMQGSKVTFNVHLLTDQHAFEQEISRLSEVTPKPAEYDEQKTIQPELVTEANQQGVGSLSSEVTVDQTTGTLETNQPVKPIVEPQPTVIKGPPTLIYQWDSQAYSAPVDDENVTTATSVESTGTELTDAVLELGSE